MKMINKKSLLFISLAVVCALLLIFIGGKSNDNNESGQIREISEYEERTEKRLCQLISELKGVSEVKVMVAAASDYEKVYAKNIQELQSETKSEYYNTGERKPLLLTELSPKINGVAVVCRGGDDLVLQQKIKELISNVLAIGTGKIFVGS